MLHGNEEDDGDNLSLCEDDDVEEQEEILSERTKPIQSSPRVIKRKKLAFSESRSALGLVPNRSASMDCLDEQNNTENLELKQV